MLAHYSHSFTDSSPALKDRNALETAISCDYGRRCSLSLRTYSIFDPFFDCGE